MSTLTTIGADSIPPSEATADIFAVPEPTALINPFILLTVATLALLLIHPQFIAPKGKTFTVACAADVCPSRRIFVGEVIFKDVTGGCG